MVMKRKLNSFFALHWFVISFPTRWVTSGIPAVCAGAIICPSVKATPGPFDIISSSLLLSQIPLIHAQQ